MPDSVVPIRRGRVARLAAALTPVPAWRTTVSALALLCLALLAIYHDTALGMVQIWLRSDTFAHALLVPPIVLWLIVRRRASLAAVVPAPAPRMLWPLGAAAVLWLLGELSQTNALEQFALVAMLALAVPAVAGLEVGRRLLFPLCFLFFAVPIGEFMLPQLMAWTADFTVAALHLTGIPVYREGLRFVIPSGVWSVVEACSGVRYLIASFMTGVLYAYLNYRSPRRRLAFAAVSLVVPVVANWLRAYLIVLLGHLSSNRLAVGADHLIYGWIFFGVVIGLMFYIGRRWSDVDHDVPAIPATRAAAPAAWRVPAPGPTWAIALVAMLLAVGPQLAEQAIVAGERAGAPQLAEPAPAGWQVRNLAPDWTPHYVAAPAQLQRSYAAPDGRVVGLYLGYYRHQEAGRKLVGSTNALVRADDPSWVTAAAGRRELAIGERTLSVRTARLRGLALPEDSGMAVWQVYWIGGTWTDSDVHAKLLTVWHRLLGRGDDAAVLVLHTVELQRGEGAAVLEKFLRAHLDTLERTLQRTRDER